MYMYMYETYFYILQCTWKSLVHVSPFVSFCFKFLTVYILLQGYYTSSQRYVWILFWAVKYCFKCKKIQFMSSSYRLMFLLLYRQIDCLHKQPLRSGKWHHHYRHYWGYIEYMPLGSWMEFPIDFSRGVFSSKTFLYMAVLSGICFLNFFGCNSLFSLFTKYCNWNIEICNHTFIKINKWM